MNLRFACTQCGRCCRDAKLPLTVAEAVGWLDDGNEVQILCEAEPWPDEPGPGDEHALHRRRRSFAAMSGSLPSRVTVVLAGNLEGRCPNLMADLRCGIYARRPLVCRIYPAEVNPFVRLTPAHKSCPPEAWTADRPMLLQDGRLCDAAMHLDILESRATDARDTDAKRALCSALGLERAGLAREGVMVFSPALPAMLDALRRSTLAEPGAEPPPPWQFVSNRTDTVATLSARGAAASLAGEPQGIPGQYFRAPARSG